MRALVVYESMFGNTEAVARAIADGLATWAEVTIHEIRSAPEAVDADVDLLVVGGPTHAFGLSRDSTRQDAATKGGDAEAGAGIGLREWIEGLEPAPGVSVATFDTRIHRPRVPGSAARAARKRLRARGFPALDPPTTFWVDGTSGPLVDGEEDRARRWGAELDEVFREHRAQQAGSTATG
jgi:hypothetical protein